MNERENKNTIMLIMFLYYDLLYARDEFCIHAFYKYISYLERCIINNEDNKNKKEKLCRN